MSWNQLPLSLASGLPLPSSQYQSHEPRASSVSSNGSEHLYNASLGSSAPSLNTSLPPHANTFGHASVVGSPVDSINSALSILIPRAALQTNRYHPTFYMQDVMSIFLVDGVLFKVHRYFLERESDVFRSMLSCPPTEEGPEGVSDDKPIFLPEVTRLEFESLLNFFYNSLYGKPLDSLDEWISLLSISSRYSMDRIRERAIEEIEKSVPPMLPVSQVVLAKKHHVKTWLAPAYEALCTRKESLTVAEAEQLGLVTSILLAEAREKLREKELCPKCRLRPTRCSTAELVREVFSL